MILNWYFDVASFRSPNFIHFCSSTATILHTNLGVIVPYDNPLTLALSHKSPGCIPCKLHANSPPSNKYVSMPSAKRKLGACHRSSGLSIWIMPWIRLKIILVICLYYKTQLLIYIRHCSSIQCTVN